MPYMAEQKTKARNISIDDIIVRDSRRIKVQDVEVKTKWVYVTHILSSAGLMMMERIAVDEDVIVSRPKATQAEMESTWHSQAAHLARVAIDEADKLVQEAKQKLLDDLDYRPDYHRWAYANYIEAQTKRTIWRSVAKLAKVDDMGLVEAMRIVRDELTDEIVRYRHESYSTSGLANSVEDVEHDTEAQWVERMKFHVPPRLARY